MATAHARIARDQSGRTSTASDIDVPRPRARICRALVESVLLLTVTAAPWAFGAVQAWAELALYVVASVVAILDLIGNWGEDRLPLWRKGPAIALGGLAVLAMVQAVPWPASVVRLADRAAIASRQEMMKERASHVLNDPEPSPVLPAPSISRDIEGTRNEAARLFAAWILFQAVLGLGSRPGPLRRFGAVVAANATLLALFTVIQVLAWNGNIYWYGPKAPSGHGGPFVCHSHLAAYLNIGLGFALAALFDPRLGRSGTAARGSRLIPAYAAGMIVTGVMVSLSRSGFVGMVVATVLVVALNRPRVKQFALGLAGIVALALIMQFATGSSASYERLATLSSGKPFADRMQIWRTVSGAWMASPLLGGGLGAFPAAIAPYLTVDRGYYFFHAENEYIELLVEGGIVGFVLAAFGVAGSARAFRRGLRDSSCAGESRILMLGALFGVVALATQCFGDFPLHIPAVGVTATILIAHAVRLAAGKSGRTGPAELAQSRGATPRRIVSNVGAFATVLLSFGLVFHGEQRARAEAQLWGSGVEPPGTYMPTAGLLSENAPELERMERAIQGALRFRPDWAEGHLRLGQVHASLYARQTSEWVAEENGDKDAQQVLSDPLWLHSIVHSAAPADRPSDADLLAQEPVRLHLLPAAKSFLRARQLCPTLAPPHAELAGLDYLIVGGPTTSVHAERALRRSGADSQTIARAGRAAAQAGDFDLAAGCWHKQLSLQIAGWPRVAALAGRVLTPDRILNRVVSSGRLTLYFGETLYAAPERRADRDRFLRAALERLPHDRDLPEAERFYLEGRIHALLGNKDESRDRYITALGLDPLRLDWRSEYVDWLIAWREFDEARKEALVGVSLAPQDKDAKSALKKSSDASARGAASAPAPAR